MTETRPPWQRLLDRIGALPTRRVTWGLVLLFSVWVVLDVRKRLGFRSVKRRANILNYLAIFA